MCDKQAFPTTPSMVGTGGGRKPFLPKPVFFTSFLCCNVTTSSMRRTSTAVTYLTSYMSRRQRSALLLCRATQTFPHTKTKERLTRRPRGKATWRVRYKGQLQYKKRNRQQKNEEKKKNEKHDKTGPKKRTTIAVVYSGIPLINRLGARKRKQSVIISRGNPTFFFGTYFMFFLSAGPSCTLSMLQQKYTRHNVMRCFTTHVRARHDNKDSRSGLQYFFSVRITSTAISVEPTPTKTINGRLSSQLSAAPVGVCHGKPDLRVPLGRILEAVAAALVV